ncbi:hypothetical protein CERSUDRAFT_116811 [Gelatoporia subvermispora B]|uniref:BZIP domain-containing protein n=1 Tax=Ceriporiopsis subvermispora (strain B) TaxID=914234 RepID=M2R7H1_CERS8|nr:hypothetical protein CERSUDRAFT_116811 [Gelatoporia subvermispora B]
MLTDNPQQQLFTMGSAFEDFFHMELLTSSNTASGSGGSSPGSSPSHTFSALPPTPPNVFPSQDISINPDSYFNFDLSDDFTKLDQFVAPPSTSIGYDFLGAFTGASGLQTSSPESASGSGTYSSMEDSPIGIDPQLVGTPLQSQPMSEFGDDDEEEEEEDDEEREESPSLAADSPEQDFPLAAVKVGGRGKAARKGTVQSGGVVKRSGGSGDRKESKPAMLSTTSSEPDDWRPSPEEYKKMSSKEKRQLRNKISARNFRVRRKEYITTLEGDIAERDRLIDAIRTELGSTKSENIALRQEIAALKKSLLDGRADTPVLPPPAPLPAIPAALLNSSSSASQTKSPLLTPNTHKDLPTSPHIGARGFWGGATGSGLGSFGGITPVHTTLVPEWGSVLSGKPLAGSKNTGRRSPTLQENINPMLNSVTATSLAGALGASAQSKNDKNNGQQLPLGAFDSFADVNPFTMKTLDAYRMQLWGKLAQQQANNRNAQQQQQYAPAQSPSGLASNLRPQYFTKHSPAAMSSLLSGKSTASAYPTPPNSPPLGTLPRKVEAQPSAHQAMLASMASQTLLGKLGSAFWDAFAARSPDHHGKPNRDLDADKVRRVLEGKAVLRIVDVEPQQTPLQQAPPLARSLSRKTENVNALSSRASSPMASPKLRAVDDKKCQCTKMLEEKMSKLALMSM